jgi:hypothetical protein
MGMVCDSDLIWDTAPEFMWRDWGKLRKPVRILADKKYPCHSFYNNIFITLSWICMLLWPADCIFSHKDGLNLTRRAPEFLRRNHWLNFRELWTSTHEEELPTTDVGMHPAPGLCYHSNCNQRHVERREGDRVCIQRGEEGCGHSIMCSLYWFGNIEYLCYDSHEVVLWRFHSWIWIRSSPLSRLM